MTQQTWACMQINLIFDHVSGLVHSRLPYTRRSEQSFASVQPKRTVSFQVPTRCLKQQCHKGSQALVISSPSPNTKPVVILSNPPTRPPPTEKLSSTKSWKPPTTRFTENISIEVTISHGLPGCPDRGQLYSIHVIHPSQKAETSENIIHYSAFWNGADQFTHQADTQFM